MTYLRQRFGLSPSSVWAIVTLFLGFFGIIAFLINGGHSPEVRSILLLIGQGFVGLVNVWMIFRATQHTNQKVDSVHDTVNDVQQTVNGTTPQPGSIPTIKPKAQH